MLERGEQQVELQQRRVRSIENVHSYGYETNGMRSWRSTAAGS